MDDAIGAVAIADEWLDHLSELIAQAPVNLVSRGDRGDVRARHLDDCVRVARHLRLVPGTQWMDLGTGGGLPGVILAAAFPTVSWTLIDARAKKIAQVAAFASRLGLANVVAVHARAEDLAGNPDARGGYDGVISRAVASLRDTIRLARPFVTTGEIIAIRGPGAAADARDLVRQAPNLDIWLETVEAIGGTIRPTWLVRSRGRGMVAPDFAKTWHAERRATRGGSSDGSA